MRWEQPLQLFVRQVCGVCNRRWDQVVRLEDSDDQLHQAALIASAALWGNTKSSPENQDSILSHQTLFVTAGCRHLKHTPDDDHSPSKSLRKSCYSQSQCWGVYECDEFHKDRTDAASICFKMKHESIFILNYHRFSSLWVEKPRYNHQGGLI